MLSDSSCKYVVESVKVLLVRVWEPVRVATVESMLTVSAPTLMPVPAPTFMVLPVAERPLPQTYAAAPVNWANARLVEPSVIGALVEHTQAVSALAVPSWTNTAIWRISELASASVALVGAPDAFTV